MSVRILPAAAAAFLGCGLASAAAAADLTIAIDGLRSDRGEVKLCVFSAETSNKAVFPDCVTGRPVKQGSAIIRGGKVVVTYSGLKPGVYAVASIHDENGDGKLGTNMVGIPTEGIGVSNNPTLFGKPDFAKSAFEIAGNTRIAITAKYFF
ncbi:hypothetical protein T281_06950 [Rhodomicrobium udaipurense JA643]|uniref:DUF2141 domain-containing protein n=1 Tax=Rhodomicrobium udaipurense TaxID=1202716 RepID=A0A8I1KJ00_9HYPH|nr:DUF2141 domain-containing protein [Rhodomicrobium udaipurense]KAI95155.1 hypothetical protein T281_06950 [Rhodomicrobium udaipurense JA643]MBJ7542306.1 DUF2141 domain-containing protein [Rhodomicrobium udaipurense]